MGFLKLITVFVLSYSFAINGKPISKRYLEHLLRHGYTSDDCGAQNSALTPLPTIIESRMDFSSLPLRYAEPLIGAALPYSYGNLISSSWSTPFFAPALSIGGNDAYPFSHSALFIESPAASLPLPLGTAVTTDCNDVPSLPLAPPAPEYSIGPEISPLPTPETPSPSYTDAVVTESLDLDTPLGFDGAAAADFINLPSTPDLSKLPSESLLWSAPPAPLPHLDDCQGRLILL